MKRRIAILMHERQRDITREYMVDDYAEFWRQDGHEVFTLYGVQEWVPADALIVHVDLSQVPEPYLQFAARYPLALNGRVRDIRKSTFSKGLLRADHDYQGPVIVKSDLNYAGLPELTLGVSETTWFRNPNDYRVYDSLSRVPPETFELPGLVVEKFLPEVEGGLFHMRALVFVGDQVTCSRMSSPKPVVNGSTQVKVEDVEPHEEILALRTQLGFDYGKFDYVVHDGKPILIDTNKTVGRPPRTSDEKILAGRRKRAQGLYAFFDR